MKAAFALVALAALSLSAQAQGFKLEAPEKVEHKPGKLVEVTAKGADQVAWEVLVVPDAELDVRRVGTTLLMGMPPPGTTVVVVAAAVQGGAPVTAKVTIVVAGDAAAEPPPAAGGNVRHVTWAHDPAAGDRIDPQAVAEAEKLSAKAGARFRTLDVSGQARPNSAEVQAFFRKYYAEAKGPVLVLQDADGEVLTAYKAKLLRPEDVAGAIANASGGK